jgi:tetratricopeptide (TPR) repeat protein
LRDEVSATDRPLAGCLYFIGSALPLLGIIDCYGMRYSFVWDHWAYIPSLGLIALYCVVVTGTSMRFLTQTSRGILACALLLAFGTLTWRQAGSYRNDEALWRDTANKNPAAWLACNYLGYYAGRRGASAEALSYYRRSIAIHPNSEAYYNLANTLALEGQAEEAIPAYREALRLDPNLSAAYVDMGTIFASQGRLADAVAEYRKAVELNPRRAHARWCLAATLQRMGRIPEAVAHYREAVRIDPNMPQALENLATILASDPHGELRNGAEAVGLAERACQLTRYEEPHSVSTLSMAYAEARRFREATSMAERAAALAAAGGDPEGAKVNRALAEQYRSGQPYRDRDNSTN